VGDGKCVTWSGKICWILGWILGWWRGAVGGDIGEKGEGAVGSSWENNVTTGQY